MVDSSCPTLSTDELLFTKGPLTTLSMDDSKVVEVCSTWRDISGSDVIRFQHTNSTISR